MKRSESKEKKNFLDFEKREKEIFFLSPPAFKKKTNLFGGGVSFYCVQNQVFFIYFYSKKRRSNVNKKLLSICVALSLIN
jgi:hypothetical protein